MDKISFSELKFTILAQSDDLSNFSCEDKDLNEYLIEDSLQDQNDKVSVTRLVYWNNDLVGFFTLVNASITKKCIKEGDGPDEFDYPDYPAIKIARLATDQRFQRRDVGKAMLLRTMAISAKLSEHVGCRFITVDAKHQSVGFYEKFGFVYAKVNKNTTSMYRNIPKE